ncbi:MAG: prolyl oligopeptidase family serine peptidase [Planctomycetes bacterium]|nr:prolyl oligopeptidase family serine peptidase [Planctomycetota bacterium]
MILAIVAGLLAAFAPSIQTNDREIVIGECLIASRGDAARRIAFWMDPVNESIVRGTWKPPAEGEKFVVSEKEFAWRKSTAGKDGWFDDGILQNGYGFFNYDSPNDEIRLFEASGQTLAYVNGELRSGDWYQGGYIRRPVHLRKGPNEFLLLSQRGRIRAKLVAADGEASLDAADAVLPDLIACRNYDSWCSVVVHNQTDRRLDGLKLIINSQDGASDVTPVPALLPLASRKIAFRARGAAPAAAGELELSARLAAGRDSAPLGEKINFRLRVRDPKSTRKITFKSEIDGSVQYYCVNPPSVLEPGKKPGLVLTLHGASVEASGQIECYAPRPNIYIVAPTNRRPYGFDWEDWGRLDALEVYQLAAREFDIDPRRVWLTGHSMGGHGTWQLGVLFPDRFAAIAPSAGWISFFSYAGLRMPASEQNVEAMMRRAAAPSDTLAYINNYKGEGVYILHGDADDNVPVTEARAMREALAKFHPDFAYHEQPGAGHWWGNACVDWAPIFELFSRREIPDDKDVKNLEFATPSPGVSAKYRWVTLEQQLKPLVASRISLNVDTQKRTISGTTENVGRFEARLAPLAAGGPVQFELDGQKIDNIAWPEGGKISLIRSGGAWGAAPPFDPSRKGPHRMGPFKDAFRNRVLFVYGTRGTPDENAWMLRKARFDAEIFQYSGNGSIDIVADSEFDTRSEPDRNVIIYGNADTNGAWAELIRNSPVELKNGRLAIGERQFEGEQYGIVMIRPRPNSKFASVGVVGGTGPRGARTIDRLSYFTSGVAYPDCVVFGPNTKKKDKIGILGAGFFGNDWDIAGGDFAWEE